MKETADKRWKRFTVSYVETGWFDDSRGKTLKAMRQLCLRVPETELEDVLPRRLIVFAPAFGVRGEVYPWYEPGGDPVDGAFIYLSPQLERLKQEVVSSIVAHEFAHVILGHHNREGTPVEDFKPVKYQRDDPIEVEADELVVKWGFKPGYKRSHGRR